MTDEERFWTMVDKRGDEDCWRWSAYVAETGYGRFMVNKTPLYAHRYSYELSRGPIPSGLTIDHLCRQRDCVNPSHLEAVTHRENILRGQGPSAQQARQTHCKNGHKFEPGATYYRKDKHGGKFCAVCANDRRRSRYRNEAEYREKVLASKRKVKVT